MDQGTHVPLSLAFEQRSSLRSWSSIRLRSALPFLRPKQNPQSFLPIVDTVPAPSNRLIEHYIQWSGGDNHLYPGEVPAHLFSQWSIPLVTRLLSQGMYPLKDIINKGCHVSVNHAIPRGERLYLRAELVELKESASQINFSIEVTTSTQSTRSAIVAVFHLVLLLEQATLKTNRKPRPVHPDYSELGDWSVDSRDGFRYALLTGDFNPIHWLDPLAKRSNFGGKVLHGFASLSKTWERIQSPAQHNQNISEISVQFIQPVHLPTTGLKVLTSKKTDRQGQYKLRVRGEGNQLHLLGKYKIQ
ncbi:hypothetical protein A9Q99_24940 [Gammaproteobacteria bacterium 45_16_T64]|nr:hypothetical protein A9Q99_24940 [Gammaproteobacteria bacterium 45_16_T64]